MSRPYLTSHYYTSIAKNGGPQQNKMQIRKEFDPVKKREFNLPENFGLHAAGQIHDKHLHGMKLNQNLRGHSSRNKIKARDCPFPSCYWLHYHLTLQRVNHTKPLLCLVILFLNLYLIYLFWLKIGILLITADHQVNNCIICIALVLKPCKHLLALLLCTKPFPFFFYGGCE